MINELKILENELGFIPVYRTEQGNKVVYGRELHEGLRVQQAFTTWIQSQLENVDGIENEDFFLLKEESIGGRPRIDYIIKLDIAKEICMVVGVAPRTNEETRRLSKQFRKYFIRIEKKYKEMIATPSYMIEDPIARAKAWIIEQEERQALENKVSEMQVRVDYLDKIQGYGNAITTKTIAVDYGMSSVAFNKLLHELHIQYKQGKVWYLYQEHKGNGYEVVTYYKDKPQMKWTLKGAEWLYHILKENGYLPILEK